MKIRLQKCCIITSILIVVFIVAFFVVYMINSGDRLQKIESVLPDGNIVSDIISQDHDNATRFTEKTGISLNLAVPQHKQLVKKINNGNWYFMNDIMEKDGLKILIVAFRNDESLDGEYQIIVEVEHLKDMYKPQEILDVPYELTESLAKAYLSRILEFYQNEDNMQEYVAWS